MPPWPAPPGAYRGGDEVGADAGGDEGLGAVDDVVVAVCGPRGRSPATSLPPPGSVIASAPIFSPLARARRTGRLELGGAGGTMIGSAILPVKRAAIVRDTPAPVNASETASASRKVPPPPPRFSARRAEQAEPRGLGVQVARHLAGVLPGLQVRDDPLRTNARAVARSFPCSSLPEGPGWSMPWWPSPPRPRPHHSGSTSGTSTCRERTHSPSASACGSNRLDAATPSPRSPCDTTLTPPRLGSGCTDVEPGGLGHLRRRTAVGGDRVHEPGATNMGGGVDCPETDAWRRRPLSPDRACATLQRPAPSACGEPRDRGRARRDHLHGPARVTSSDALSEGSNN